jgi:hypothetical protein
LIVLNSATTLEAGWYDGGTQSNVGETNFNPTVGDHIEIAAVLNADGTVRALWTDKDGTVRGSGTSTAQDPLASSWDVELHVGTMGGVTKPTTNHYQTIKIVKAVDVRAAVDGTEDDALLAEIRGFRLRPTGD